MQESSTGNPQPRLQGRQLTIAPSFCVAVVVYAVCATTLNFYDNSFLSVLYVIAAFVLNFAFHRFSQFYVFYAFATNYNPVLGSQRHKLLSLDIWKYYLQAGGFIPFASLLFATIPYPLPSVSFQERVKWPAIMLIGLAGALTNVLTTCLFIVPFYFQWISCGAAATAFVKTHSFLCCQMVLVSLIGFFPWVPNTGFSILFPWVFSYISPFGFSFLVSVGTCTFVVIMLAAFGVSSTVNSISTFLYDFAESRFSIRPQCVQDGRHLFEESSFFAGIILLIFVIAHKVNKYRHGQNESSSVMPSPLLDGANEFEPPPRLPPRLRDGSDPFSFTDFMRIVDAQVEERSGLIQGGMTASNAVAPERVPDANQVVIAWQEASVDPPSSSPPTPPPLPERFSPSESQ